MVGESQRYSYVGTMVLALSSTALSEHAEQSVENGSCIAVKRGLHQVFIVSSEPC